MRKCDIQLAMSPDPLLKFTANERKRASFLCEDWRKEVIQAMRFVLSVTI